MTSKQFKELVGLARMHDRGVLLLEKVSRMENEMERIAELGADEQWLAQQKSVIESTRRQARSAFALGNLARMQLEELLGNIRDEYLYNIITRHYLSGHPWKRIAVTLGGGNSADGIRKAATRYLQQINIVDIAQKV